MRGQWTGDEVAATQEAFRQKKRSENEKEENVFVGVEEGFGRWGYFDKVCLKILSTPKIDLKDLVETLVYDVWSKDLVEITTREKIYFAWLQEKSYFARPGVIEE